MEALQPILDLLGGNTKSWLTTVIAWGVAIRFALIFFHERIQHLITDRINAVAASESTDDDEYLRRLFAHPTYRFIAFVLLIIGLPMPTLTTLERALKLQQEAAAAAKPVTVTPGKIAGLFLAIAAAAVLVTGCAGKLDPGADPLIVSIERTQTFSEGGFDLVINLDHADRGFWRTNAPAFHQFAEYLREKLPVTNVPGRTNLQRYLLAQWQLDQAKLAYRATKSAATSNEMVAARIVLQDLSNQTAAWLTIVTNKTKLP